MKKGLEPYLTVIAILDTCSENRKFYGSSLIIKIGLGITFFVAFGITNSQMRYSGTGLYLLVVTRLYR